MGKHLLKLTLLVAALTAGCATKPAPVVEPAPLPLNTFIKKWATEIDQSSGKIARIFVREDLVFAYTTDGTSFVCSRATGTLLHFEKIPGGLGNLHPPVLLKDSIVYPSVVSLQVYDRKDGRFNRRVDLPVATRSDAVGSRNLLFVAADYSNGGRLICLDLGRPYVPIKWGLMFPGGAISSTPAVHLDALYAAGEDGKVTAVGADNRVPVWDLGFFQTDGPIYADLQADDTGLYVASGDSKLYCINRNSGKVKWQFHASAPLKATPALTKDFVFEYVPDTGVVALDKLAAANDPKSPQYNRQPKWTVGDAVQFLAEDESFVYLQMKDNSVAAIDRASGSIEFRSKRKDFVAFAINPKDGVIFAATANRLMAVERVRKAGTVGELVLVEPEQSLGGVTLASR